jgi:hypothetical protein
MYSDMVALLNTLGIRVTDDADISSDFPGRILPSTLEMVLIHAPLWGSVLDAPPAWASELEKSKRIFEEVKKVQVLAEERPEGMKDVEQYWLDRIDGGDGWWKLGGTFNGISRSKR